MCFALSLVHAKVPSALTVWMSSSPLSPKFPTVELQWSKSSASVHCGDALSPI